MPDTPAPAAAAPAAMTGKAALTDWAVGVLRSLTLQNILILALLALVAIPSYAAYKFLTDASFRSEFVDHVRLVDADVPCLVYEGQLAGQQERTYVFVGYAFDGRLERVIGVRTSQGILTVAQLGPVCDRVVAEARTATQHSRETEDRDERATKPTGGYLDGK